MDPVDVECGRVWATCLRKKEHGLIKRNEFEAMYRRLCETLLVSATATPEQIANMTAVRCKNYAALNQAGVFHFLKELCELYCQSNDTSEHAAFLARIRECLSTSGRNEDAANTIVDKHGFKLDCGSMFTLEAFLLERHTRLFGKEPKFLECESDVRKFLEGWESPLGASPCELKLDGHDIHTVTKRDVSAAVLSGLGKRPRVWVVGLPHSGKSSVAKQLCAKLGAVYLSAQSGVLGRDDLLKGCSTGCGYVIDGGHDDNLIIQLVVNNPDCAPMHVVMLSGDHADIVGRLEAVRKDPASGQHYIGAEVLRISYEQEKRKTAQEAAKEVESQRNAATITAGEGVEDDADEEESKEDGEKQEDKESKETELSIASLVPVYENAYSLVKESACALVQLIQCLAGCDLTFSNVNASEALDVVVAKVYGELTDSLGALGYPKVELPRLPFSRDHNEARALVWTDADETAFQEAAAEAAAAATSDNEEGDDGGYGADDTAEAVEAAEPEQKPINWEEERTLRAAVLYGVPLEVSIPPEPKEPVVSEENNQPTEEEELKEPTIVKCPATYSFRKLSDWRFVCPVTNIEGRAQWSVLFENQVYFCSSKKAMESFITVPRTYTAQERHSSGRVLIVAGPQTSVGDVEAICQVAAGRNNTVVKAGKSGEGAAESWAALATTLNKEYNNAWFVHLNHDDLGEKGSPAAFLTTLAEAKACPRKVVLIESVTSAVGADDSNSNSPAQVNVPKDDDNSDKSNEEYARSVTNEVSVKSVVPMWTEACQAFGDALSFSCFDLNSNTAHHELSLEIQRAVDIFQEPNSAEQVFVAGLEAGEPEVATELVSKCLGWSGRFCPVTLHKSSRLIPGSNATGRVFHESAFYLCADEQAKHEFLQEPSRFVSIVDRPKPVVLVLGAPGSGKSSLAAALQRSLGLGILDRTGLEVLDAEKKEVAAASKVVAKTEAKAAREAAKAEVKAAREAVKAEAKAKGEPYEDVEEGKEDGEPEEVALQENGEEDPEQAGVPDETLFEYLEAGIARCLAENKGCVLDDLVLSAEHVQLLVTHKLHPTVVLHAKVSDDVAVARRMAKTFSWSLPEPPAPVKVEEGDEPEEAAPSPTHEELVEMKEAAETEAEAVIREQVAGAQKSVAAVAEALKEFGVLLHSLEMNGKTGLTHPTRIACSVVAQFCADTNSCPSLNKHRVCRLESPELAAAMLNAGLLCAPMGSYCPVTVLESGYLDRVMDKGALMAFEGELFLVHSGHAAAAFAANPSRYADFCSTSGAANLTRATRRCAVLNGSGSSSGSIAALCQAMSNSHGLVVVSAESAVNFVANGEDAEVSHSGLVSDLVKQIRATIAKGESLASDQVTRCVERQCRARDAVLNGFVLESFPRDEHELEQLVHLGLAPDTAFIVQGSSMDDPPTNQWLALERCLNSTPAEALMRKTHYLDTDQSIWALHRAAVGVMDAKLTAITRAYSNLTEMTAHKQQTLETKRNLTSMGVERLSARHLLGARAQAANFPACTNCLVSFCDTGGSLVAASPIHQIAFGGRLYGFADQACADLFAESPSQYINNEVALADTIAALPASPEQLLCEGRRVEFMERTLAPLICKALEMLGANRVKHPSLSVQESCLKFLAMHLRATNPSVTKICCTKREETLATFLEECQLYNRITENAVVGSGVRALRKRREQKVKQQSQGERSPRAFEEEPEELLNRFRKLLRSSPSVLKARLNIK